MTKMTSEQLRAKTDKRLFAMIDQFYRDVPYATYQRDETHINRDYYHRHSIETVLRIRHKRMVDALVVHHYTKHNPKIAKAWAHYLEDEMLHGQMFAKDIERLFGTSFNEINQYEPLFATKLLNGYFYFTLEHEGPMASIVSAYFLEFTTRMTQPQWLDNLAKVFGEEKIRGARAHVNHDINEGHNDFVWDVLYSTVETEEDQRRLEQHLENIYGLFAAYFTEVYLTTIGKSASSQVAYNVARVAIEQRKAG